MRRRLPRRAGEPRPSRSCAALLVRKVHRRVPVVPQQIEQHVDHREFVQQARICGVVVDVHALLQSFEARPAVVVERDDLAVEHDVARAERLAELAELRIAVRDVVAVARDEPNASAVDVADRADAVPLQLPRPAVARRLLSRRASRTSVADPSGGARAVGILRRIHAVDHPLVAARAEQHVTARRRARRGT